MSKLKLLTMLWLRLFRSVSLSWHRIAGIGRCGVGFFWNHLVATFISRVVTCLVLVVTIVVVVMVVVVVVVWGVAVVVAVSTFQSHLSDLYIWVAGWFHPSASHDSMDVWPNIKVMCEQFEDQAALFWSHLLSNVRKEVKYKLFKHYALISVNKLLLLFYMWQSAS